MSQRLVYAILQFLTDSIADGTVAPDDREGLEVAIQCIAEAFSVDPSDARLSVKPATLQSIFDVFLKTREKVAPSAPSQPSPTPEDKAQADAHKQRGNSLMSAKKYDDAIDAYNQSVALDPTNPVYYSNRAAAYSSKGDHLAAVGDAEKAIALDPKFLKSYHRLGHAYWGLGDSDKAVQAYQRGLAHDPQNEGLLQASRIIQQRVAEPTTAREPIPDPPAPAAGGLPDLAGLMNNPQMRAMAQQLASSGGLSNLMQNPGVQNMMNRLQSGNMPSMEELMSDPSLRELASQFGAGAGSGRS